MPNVNASDYRGVTAETYRGMTILRPSSGKTFRRVFYLNSYGMAKTWREVKEGAQPGQHLWGCLELARAGYEIAMPEEPRTNGRFFNYRRQDFPHVGFARNWLGREGILYSAHTILFWAPLLAELKLMRCPIVTMTYARDENPRFSGGYRGILALTPCAAQRARELAPRARIEHISWGVDLTFFPLHDYRPEWFLSCGKTRRDFPTLAAAATTHPAPVQVINTKLPAGITWPANVKQITGGGNGTWETVTHQRLVREHYAGCSAALVLLQSDPNERFAAGFTQLLEGMAMGKPVIMTRTGALPGEIDVEKEGCGLMVPPDDPAALARAMKTITDDPARAAAMGRAGRRLCETRYNIERYAADLRKFFEAL